MTLSSCRKEKEQFDRIYWIARDPSESKLCGFEAFMNYDKNGKEKDPKPFHLLSEEQFLEMNAEQPLIDEFDQSTHTLIVFDDAISYSSATQRIITEAFIRGRKRGVSVIYTSHIGIITYLKSSCDKARYAESLRLCSC